MASPRGDGRWAHLREEEPFATLRAHPRRFGLGIPAVFVVSIGAGLPFVFRNLSLAIAIQLGLQTGGLLWLYLPVALRRWRDASPDAPRRDDEVG